MKSEFTTKPLSALADIQTGPFGSQLHKEDYVQNGTPIVTVEHLGQKRFTEQNLPCVSEIDKERLSKYILREGDVVFSRVGSVDRCSYVSREYNGWMFSGRCLRVRPCIEIDSQYLYYYFTLESTKQFVRGIATGATMPSINTKFMGEVPIAYPPIDEQRKIATVLSALDNKIELNDKINKNLLQQALAVYKAWFCDYILSDGVFPESWHITTVDALSSLVTRGIAPKYDDSSNQIVLNQKCIRDHTIDVSLARRHLPKKINEKWICKGDLLINSTGTGTLGRVAQVWFDANNMTVDSHVTIVRPKSSILQSYIGFWGFSHESEIEAQHTGSTGQTELPRDRVKAMELPLPDEDTLSKFNELVIPMTDAVVSNQKENARLTQLRDTLLPKLMSGELDVSDIEI